MADRKNYMANITEWRERVEKVKSEGERIARLMCGWRRGKTERMSGWVGRADPWVQAAGGGRESVNPWDIRCPDLASGGREDGLATKDPLRKQEQERGREGGDGGVEKKKGVRRISMARQRHVWISLPSLQSLTLQQRRSGSNWEREKKCLLILP